MSTAKLISKPNFKELPDINFGDEDLKKLTTHTLEIPGKKYHGMQDTGDGTFYDVEDIIELIKNYSWKSVQDKETYEQICIQKVRLLAEEEMIIHKIFSNIEIYEKGDTFKNPLSQEPHYVADRYIASILDYLLGINIFLNSPMKCEDAMKLDPEEVKAMVEDLQRRFQIVSLYIRINDPETYYKLID